MTKLLQRILPFLIIAVLLATVPVLRPGMLEDLLVPKDTADNPGGIGVTSSWEPLHAQGHDFWVTITPGNAFGFVDSNTPSISGEEKTDSVYVRFSEPDSLGRTGPVTACLDTSLFPETERESLPEYEPAAWHSDTYPFIEGEYLYNRCHLIAWQLSGSNDPRGLITGTRWLNAVSMAPFERMLSQYLYANEKTGARILYRVTPVYVDNELLCRGLLLEAASVPGSDGADPSSADPSSTGPISAGPEEPLRLCVFCPNIQPGVWIDYTAGANAPDGTITAETPPESTDAPLVLNLRTRKYHLKDCEKTASIYRRNLLPYYGTAQELLDAGFIPCSFCIGK